MRARRIALFSGCAISAAALNSPTAAETITYTYDGLGRLSASAIAGGPNNGTQTAICMDAAGNRTNYVTMVAASAACTAPTTPTPPPSPPPPGNNPPVANPNAISAPKCVTRQINVTANDTDPEGNYPLQVTGTDQPWAYPISASTIELFTPDTNGVYTVNYTVADSLGATSTGVLTVTVTGNQQCS